MTWTTTPPTEPGEFAVRVPGGNLMPSLVDISAGASLPVGYERWSKAGVMPGEDLVAASSGAHRAASEAAGDDEPEPRPGEHGDGPDEDTPDPSDPDAE